MNADEHIFEQQMALDFLAVPASTVQSERENSKAKYVITDTRNRISSKAVQATMCLKSWNLLLAGVQPETLVID